jgi:copper chaperone CopZ
MTKEYYIKNMVCDRCIKVVKNELNASGVNTLEVILGRVVIDTEDEISDKQKLNKVLVENGFILISSPEAVFSEAVKIELIKLLEKLPLKTEGTFIQLSLSSLKYRLFKNKQVIFHNRKDHY